MKNSREHSTRFETQAIAIGDKEDDEEAAA